MPIKFIVTGDLHYCLQNPKARLDIYQETLEHKLNEVYELAREYRAKAIIIPGDIFDSAGVSIPGIWGLAKKLELRPCPIITIPGNHDAWGHNLSTISRTPYGLLKELGYVRCVHNSYLETSTSMAGAATNTDVFVSGHGYDAETDNDISQYGIPMDVPRTGFNIHISHGMLLNKSFGFDVKHTLLDELDRLPDKDKPHVLINGHYHFGLPLSWAGKTLVINPGALGRLTAHVEEMEREVKVALLTISSVDDYDAKFISLKSARPGCEILSREHIEAAEVRNERLEAFLKLLGSETESRFMEVQEIVENVAESDNLPKEVVKEALRRIREAKEVITGRD